MSHLKVNHQALQLVAQLLAEPDLYRVNVISTPEGPTIIDAGVEVSGGYLAGKVVTEICLGGLGVVDFFSQPYGKIMLPAIQVYTDHPTVATLGSQYAGWRIRRGDYQAIASGPARALALKPKEMYDTIGYRDHSDRAVIVFEAATLPDSQVGAYVAAECGIHPKDLYMIVAPTTSVVGSIQVSGRIVETGLHKLMELGYNPRNVVSGLGVAPIAPVHPQVTQAMGRTNSMILYGGVVCLAVEDDDDERLQQVVAAAPSSSSKDYGRPFADIFEAVDYDFYQIDPGLFAPAVVMVNNVASGRVFQAGQVNDDVIARSIA